ncbi:MAG TPA: lipoprotein insertase outer membrane protein LolB [Thermomonas sp.]|nr:lipoprotein insertase outer membrane protein LolB [Thermomonas sp.]
MKPRLWPALGLVALAGCQGVPMADPAPAEVVVGGASESAAAIAHRQRIARLGLTDGDCAAPDWTMTGRVALSNGRDGGSGRLEWSQSRGKARIELSAPITRQGWVLELDASGAALQGVPDGPVHGRDAGALLRERTGWDIPVAGLGCWVRGAWASEAAFGEARIGYDRGGQVQRIEQAGWTIEYTDWRLDAVSGVELPGRITALRAESRVRLVVDRWSAE